MYIKIAVFVAIIGVAVGQYGHGHAVSSQNVVLQNVPVVAHHAPVIAYLTPIAHHQPSHYAVYSGNHADYHAPAHYSFEYSVEDSHTGDIKSQHESREGDAVQGSYSLHETDGTVRRVDYTADAHNGFNAVVHREGQVANAVPDHQPSQHSYH